MLVKNAEGASRKNVAPWEAFSHTDIPLTLRVSRASDNGYCFSVYQKNIPFESVIQADLEDEPVVFLLQEVDCHMPWAKNTEGAKTHNVVGYEVTVALDAFKKQTPPASFSSSDVHALIEIFEDELKSGDSMFSQDL